jgi:hypothetical protein
MVAAHLEQANGGFYFLRAKIKMASFKGFQVEPEALHEVLYPHQRDIVRWAVQGGNRAIFAKFGLGKSSCSASGCARFGAAGGLGLIVCPLGVRQELIRDAAMLGMRLVFIRSAAEIGRAGLLHHELRDGARRQARPGAVHGREPGRGERAALASAARPTRSSCRCSRACVQAGQHRHAEPQPLQGTDPLRRLPRRDGHRPGADPLLPARQREGRQPDALPAQGTGVLAVGQQLGRVRAVPERPGPLGRGLRPAGARGASTTRCRPTTPRPAPSATARR